MKFGLLGPLAVWQDDGRELDLGGAKQRALLADLLLHANEVVPTARLVDDLWEERPPATGVKAVQVHVAQLRKTLGSGVVVTRPTGYVLCLDADALDIRRFERMLERGRALLAKRAADEAGPLLREALGLWRGPALVEFRYKGFARDESARLEDLRLVALEQRLEADLALGRHGEAVPELEALVRAYPDREDFLELLMLALYRAGRQVDALAVYRQARSHLSEDLGLEPGQRMQRLEQRILVQDPTLDLKGDDRIGPPAVARRAPPQPLVCPSCGRANPPDASHCDSCGEALMGEPPVSVRKVVTVVVADIVASSEHGEQLDPESLRLVTSRYFERAAAVVERHGGVIEKVIGDEVMAVFGDPLVREDDALRAVRAAMELLDSVVGENRPETRIGLEVRIGINTGEVVAGVQTAGRGLLSGDALVVAKRLEQAADPGTIVLGSETYALVRHAVEVSELRPLKLGGKRNEVGVYRLESLDAEAVAIPRTESLPLIGRERELEQIRAVYAGVTTEGSARLLTLLGEPGIGKSRLALSFLNEIGSEATGLVGRCPPYGEGVTFLPLREALRQAGRERGVLTGPAHEVFAAVRHIFEEVARERPLVAVFDDVQWAEPTFLDCVEYLVGLLAAAPVLVLCIARPELAARRPGWLQPPATALTLEPLSAVDSESLLEALGTPAEARQRIVTVADGNPLFAEQLAAMADAYGSTGKMPGSIRAVLDQRLDRLDRGERLVLERAAVVGRSFSLEAILALTPEAERETIQTNLLALARARFVRPDTTAPEEGFRFHHALIRDAAYEGIPNSTRADLHERTALRLEAEQAEEALIGNHFAQAYQFRRMLEQPDVDLAARAGRYLYAAGRKAFVRSDLPATVDLFERARALFRDGEATPLLVELGEALFESGRFGEAEDVLSEAIQRAEPDPLLASRARVEHQFVRLHSETGSGMGAALDVATAALRVFEEAADDLGQCRALSLRAHTAWTQGNVTTADDAWRRAAVHARAAGEERDLFPILGWRASASVVGPSPVVEAIKTCREIRDEVKHSPVAVAYTLHPLAALHAMVGEFDEARALIQEANDVLGGLGRMHSAVSHHEAFVRMLAGELAEAETCLQDGYTRLNDMGEKAFSATTAAFLARVTYAQERYDEAGAYCAVCEDSGALDDRSVQVPSRGVRAKILARQGKFAEAEALALTAVSLIAETDMLNRHGDALLDLVDVYRAAGQPAEADLAAREAFELFSRKGNVVMAAHARSLLAAAAAS